MTDTQLLLPTFRPAFASTWRASARSTSMVTFVLGSGPGLIFTQKGAPMSVPDLAACTHDELHRYEHGDVYWCFECGQEFTVQTEVKDD